MKLHPEIIERDGKKVAVIDYEEFLRIEALLENIDDARLFEEAKKEYGSDPGKSLEVVKRELGI